MQTMMRFVVIGMFSLGMVRPSGVQAEPRPTRDAKGSRVSFRPASATSVQGYERMTLETDGSTVYVAAQSIWSGSEVVAAQAGESRGGSSLELTLISEAAQRAATPRGDRLAVFVDDKLTSVGALTIDGTRVTISGLRAPNAERVVKLLNGLRPAPAPILPVVTVVPAGMEDGAYLFDVSVQGVTNLRTYQVGLVVDGGARGHLLREDVQIDESRVDFVFRDLDVVAATDHVGGRLAGVLRDGAVDEPGPAYLGTFAFRATPDASGTFQIQIDSSGEKSFLADSQNEMLEFATGPGAMVTIGGATTRRTDQE